MSRLEADPYLGAFKATTPTSIGGDSCALFLSQVPSISFSSRNFSWQISSQLPAASLLFAIFPSRFITTSAGSYRRRRRLCRRYQTHRHHHHHHPVVGLSYLLLPRHFVPRSALLPRARRLLTKLAAAANAACYAIHTLSRSNSNLFTQPLSQLGRFPRLSADTIRDLCRFQVYFTNLRIRG